MSKYTFIFFCALVFIFLIAPILVIIPLSFNSEPYFTYPMPGISFEWYEDFFTSPQWQRGLQNSIIVAVSTTATATVLGTLAALGLCQPRFPLRPVVMSLLISPLIVPIVITALGVYYFYARVGLANSYLGIILAHTALATPFVVITVTSTLVGFDWTLARAAAGLGAPPVRVFFKVTLPLILPGVIAGALFAFVTSFDEVVVVLFVASPAQQTLPRVMFSGLREQLSPTILAAATLLICLSIVLLTGVELLRRRAERLRSGRYG